MALGQATPRGERLVKSEEGDGEARGWMGASHQFGEEEGETGQKGSAQGVPSVLSVLLESAPVMCLILCPHGSPGSPGDLAPSSTHQLIPPTAVYGTPSLVQGLAGKNPSSLTAHSLNGGAGAYQVQINIT